MCRNCLNECCCDPGFCLSVSAEGRAITISKDIVTSTASASACSAISYEDAWLHANALAKETARIVAKNDANIIDQTLLIINSHSLIPLITGLTLGDNSHEYSGIFSTTGSFSEGLTGTTGSFSEGLTGTTGSFSESLSSAIGSFSGSLNIGSTDTKLTGSSSGLLINGFLSLVNEAPAGSTNIGIGLNSLSNIKNGQFNIGLGAGSLKNIISGSGNVGIGPGCLAAINGGIGNFSLGAYSGLKTKGNFNGTIGTLVEVPNPIKDHQIQIGGPLDTTFIDNLQISQKQTGAVFFTLDTTTNNTAALNVVLNRQTSFASFYLTIPSTFSTTYTGNKITIINILGGIPFNSTFNIVINNLNTSIPVDLTSTTNVAIYTSNSTVLPIPVGFSRISLTSYNTNPSLTSINSYIFTLSTFTIMTTSVDPNEISQLNSIKSSSKYSEFINSSSTSEMSLFKSLDSYISSSSQ